MSNDVSWATYAHRLEEEIAQLKKDMRERATAGEALDAAEDPDVLSQAEIGKLLGEEITEDATEPSDDEILSFKSADVKGHIGDIGEIGPDDTYATITKKSNESKVMDNG